MSTNWKSYARFFHESWSELEKEYRKNNINPQHENDVVCYLYYAMARKLKKKRWPLHLIRTEDTKYIRKQALRPDLNFNDRLFVEVKMYGLREYGEGWDRRKRNISHTAKKLEKYVRHTRAKTSYRVRKPILAIWFRRRDRNMQLSFEETLIPPDLEKKLDDEVQKYKDRVTIVFGPRSH